MTNSWRTFILMVSIILTCNAQETLTLRGDTTIIIDGSKYAGAYLQWILLATVAQADNAADYEPGVQDKPSVDRSATAAFPLYRISQANSIPADKAVIAIGNTAYLTEADRAKIAANPGAVLIRREGQVIIIAGETPGNPWEGEMAAMSHFLNTVCGIRFYAPEPLWWSKPAQGEIVIDALDQFQKPTFAKTTWSGRWWANFPHQWDRLTKPLSQAVDLRGNHAIITYFSPDTYYDTYPQIYEMKEGKRPKPSGKFWNPCLSAKELPELAMQGVRQRLADKPDTAYLAFGVMDTQFDCHCEPCQASVKAHDGSYSNLYYTFLNAVAKQCQEEFPDLYLTSYIYSNVRRPPDGIRIEPNIVVDYVSKSYQWGDPMWAARDQENILAWANLGASWVIHDWSFGGITPRAYTRQFAQFLQWGGQHGMKGLYVEWSHYKNWHLDGARYWIMRQLMTDPYQDVDTLWRGYCDDMYGAGSEHMYRFFQHFADKYTYANNYCDLEDWPKQEFALYTPEDIAYQRDLLTKARALTTDDAAIQQRFDELMPYFEQHAIWVKAVGEPAGLAHRQLPEGTIDREAVAFYVNDDGSALRQAIDTYRRMHVTDDPEIQRVYQQFYFLPEYTYNYSRSLGQILQTIRQQSIAKVGLDSITNETPVKVLATARQILHDHLPETHDPKDLARVEGLLNKAILVPTQTAAPTIDGKIDEPAWETATVLDNFSIRANLLPSEHRTSGKIMRVSDHLAIAIQCHQVGPIWAETAADVATGPRIWRESGVELMISPPGTESHKEIAQYIITAFGAWRGFSLANGVRDGVQRAVQLDEKAGTYTIEVLIPLKTATYDFSQEPVLTFNITRNVYTSNSNKALELIGWAPIFHTARNEKSRGLLFFSKRK